MKNRNRQGFSLIEIALVLLIIGLLAIPVTQKIFRKTKSRVTESMQIANSLSSFIGYGFIHSIVNSKPVKFNIDANTGKIMLQAQNFNKILSIEKNLHISSGADTYLSPDYFFNKIDIKVTGLPDIRINPIIGNIEYK